MSNVIQIPTPLNVANVIEEKGEGVDVRFACASEPGAMMIGIGDQEIWVSVETAQDIIETMSETLSDALAKLALDLGPLIQKDLE